MKIRIDKLLVERGLVPSRERAQAMILAGRVLADEQKIAKSGATVEEKGFDTTLTAGGMLALLEASWRALPGIEELPIDEMWVGHRPGSRDDAPILGAGPVDGLVYATGHHRNGILLTPVSADTIARLVLDGIVDPAIAPFGIERFAPARAAS